MISKADLIRRCESDIAAAATHIAKLSTDLMGADPLGALNLSGPAFRGAAIQAVASGVLHSLSSGMPVEAVRDYALQIMAYERPRFSQAPTANLANAERLNAWTRMYRRIVDPDAPQT